MSRTGIAIYLVTGFLAVVLIIVSGDLSPQKYVYPFDEIDKAGCDVRNVEMTIAANNEHFLFVAGNPKMYPEYDFREDVIYLQRIDLFQLRWMQADNVKVANSNGIFAEGSTQPGKSVKLTRPDLCQDSLDPVPAYEDNVRIRGFNRWHFEVKRIGNIPPEEWWEKITSKDPIQIRQEFGLRFSYLRLAGNGLHLMSQPGPQDLDLGPMTSGDVFEFANGDSKITFVFLVPSVGDEYLAVLR